VIIKTNIPPPPSTRLIPVASENLPCKASEVSEIDGVGEVLCYYEIERGEDVQGLFLLSIGKRVENAFKAYPRSERIYFFVVKTETK